MFLMQLSCCGVLSEGGGTRTHDLGIKSPLLYQLSYAPATGNVASRQGKLKSIAAFRISPAPP
jgi:hypothetical protein